MKCEKCHYYYEEDYIIYDEIKEIYLCKDCYQDFKIVIKAKNASIKGIKETVKKIIDSSDYENITDLIIKQYNNFNPNDDYLKEIVLEVGRVSFPIYLYGLYNRKEFELRCSRDIFSLLVDLRIVEKNTIPTPKGEVGIEIENGEKRLGISHDLRKNYRSFCIELIRKITNTQNIRR